jgi:hypothetical protein
MKGKSSKQLIPVLLVLLLIPAIAQTAQIVHGQNMTTSNQWALSLSIENAQNVSCSTFAPFNQIQLFSTVTYGNASVPDLLVTFKVQGPADAASPTNITAIGKTDAAGIANASFRLPVEAQDTSSVTGTWQATATIQTGNGTLQKSSSFTTQWTLKITSISTQNQQGQNQTIFFSGNKVTVALAISDAGPPQQANITLNMQDASGKTVNQTQIENTQITNSSTSPTQMQATLEIPANAVAGEASITAAIYSGTYQNMEIPAGENQTAYFDVVGIGTALSPSPTPTKMPNILQNSVSLFAWLLVATGIFTFTALYLFLRRKPKEVGIQLPGTPPTVPGPIISTPSPVEAATPQETTPQPAPQFMAANSTMATAKTFQATTADIQEPVQMEEKPVAVTEATVEPTPLESAITEEPTPKAMMSQVSRIQDTVKRIQTIKAALELEKEQFARDLAELNQAVDERERTLKNYVDTMRGEVGKLKKYLNDNEDVTPEKTAENSVPEAAGKPDLESILTKELVLKAMSTHQNRISSLVKRTEALKLVLKLEKEQLGEDFEELNKAVDDQEKTIKNHFNTVREEIEKLKKNHTDKETKKTEFNPTWKS